MLAFEVTVAGRVGNLLLEIAPALSRQHGPEVRLTTPERADAAAIVERLERAGVTGIELSGVLC